MRQQSFPVGAVVFRAGDASTEVYVIEDGEVAISVGAPGHPVEVARLGPGALFGESGVLEARLRSATATACRPTTLLVTPAETFVQAFGLDNERALTLVRLLCSRLRATNARSLPGGQAVASGDAPLRIFPAHPRLQAEYGVTPVDVGTLPFLVGNRFGGEGAELRSNHSLCIPARGEPGFSAPHFEILRRDGEIGVRDLGSRGGTIVNGHHLNRESIRAFVELQPGDNEVIAGGPKSPFRFRVQLRGARS